MPIQLQTIEHDTDSAHNISIVVQETYSGHTLADLPQSSRRILIHGLGIDLRSPSPSPHLDNPSRPPIRVFQSLILGSCVESRPCAPLGWNRNDHIQESPEQ